MSRLSRLTSWAKDELIVRVLVTWLLPVTAGVIISSLAHLSRAWQVTLIITLVITAKWLWQLRADIRDTYRHALMHADEGAAAGIPALEPRYVALRFKRGLSPGIWAVVIYDSDSIRMYQGLGKIPRPPQKAEKSRFARQVG